VDTSWNRLYLAGAVSAVVTVAMYIAALVLFVAAPAPPDSGGASMLEYVDAHRAVYIARQVLWLVPSLPLMIVFLALTAALWRLNPSYVAIAGTMAVVSWSLSFAFPTAGEGSFAMVRLADQYSAATSESERATSVAGAELLIALLDAQAPIGVLQTMGVLLMSLLMLRGVFTRNLAWLGVATGAIGVASELLRPVLGWGYAVYGVVILVWLLWLAFELRQLAGRPVLPAENSVEK
jgi:hypothetical protein